VKAAVMYETGGPEVIRIEETPNPTPGPTDVVIKVAACGVCGHDQADRQGLTHVDTPIILGHEIAGTVVEAGEKVHAFTAGDRVASKQFTTCGWCQNCRGGREMACPQRRFNYGGCAEYVAMSEQSIIRVPDEVDLTDASVVACCVGTCLRALRQVATLLPGEHVVVTGMGGGLGIHGIQVAKAMGARTIGVTSSAQKVEALKGFGADAVVLSETPDYWQAIMDATDGRGADVVLDNVGHPSLFGPCFRALARGGRYVFTGQVYRQKIDLYPAFVFGKEAIITGSASTRMAEFIDAMELVRAGAVQPVIQRFPLSAVVEANRRLDNRAVFGRAVLTP
jgi:acryloyl-coenzyme A reductase